MTDDIERYLKGLPKILASDIKGLDRTKSQYVYAKSADKDFKPGTSAEYFATDLPPDKMLAMNGLILVAQTKAQEFGPDLKPKASGTAPALTWKPRNRKERRSQDSYARRTK